MELEFAVYVVIGLGIALLVLFIIPLKANPEITEDFPTKRYDERDIMFSRWKLIPGSEKYKAYYQNYPEHETLDNNFRKEPGLLSPESVYYHKKAFEAADNYFSQVDQLHHIVDGKPSLNKIELSSQLISGLLKNKVKNLGAHDTGITVARDYHFYSHKGRRSEYGNEIKITHQYALAFIVEMEGEMVGAAPKASIVMESARQYLNAGKIATQIAEDIRELGYNARAHIDGNYQVVCPLVARDAGLGEIGRMGLLMTPDLGPRVRIGVVTTDMELVPDEYFKQNSVIDFCRMCNKCADCCPGNSIPYGDPVIVYGIKRWKINSESCFTFWCKAGTDCGRCMSVCPYSHPNRSWHKLIRWGIKHSKFFRFLALKLDDFFYGKKPLPKPLPRWLDEM
ncbi:4Fe-4S dicluster domain-containing protein [Bacteroidota bacterium]